MAQDNTPQPRQNSPFLVIGLVIFITLVAGTAVVLAFSQRGEMQQMLAAAQIDGTEIAQREQTAVILAATATAEQGAALNTAVAAEGRAQDGAATAIAALNAASTANAAQVTEAGFARAADLTAVAAQNLAATAEALASEAQALALTATNAQGAAVDLASTESAHVTQAARRSAANATQARNNYTTALALQRTSQALWRDIATLSPAVVQAQGTAAAALTAVGVQEARADRNLGTAIAAQTTARHVILTATKVAATLVARSSDVVVATATSEPTRTPESEETPVFSEAGVAFPGIHQGTVPESGYEVWYYFGTEGEVLTIDVDADYEVTMILYDADFNALTFGDYQDDARGSRIADFTLSANGTPLYCAIRLFAAVAWPIHHDA